MSIAEDNLRRALRASMDLNGDRRINDQDGERTDDVDSNKDSDKMRMPRVVIDLKIPLWGVVCVGGGILWGLIAMFFTAQETARNVADVQATIKAMNIASQQYTSEQAIIKYRLDRLESPPGKQKD